MSDAVDHTKQQPVESHDHAATTAPTERSWSDVAADLWHKTEAKTSAVAKQGQGALRVGTEVAKGAVDQVVHHPLQTLGDVAAGLGVAAVAEVAGVGAVGAAAIAAIPMAAYGLYKGVEIAKTEGMGAIPEHMKQGWNEAVQGAEALGGAISTVYHNDSTDPKKLEEAKQKVQGVGGAGVEVAAAGLGAVNGSLGAGAIRGLADGLPGGMVPALAGSGVEAGAVAVSGDPNVAAMVGGAATAVGGRFTGSKLQDTKGDFVHGSGNDPRHQDPAWPKREGVARPSSTDHGETTTSAAKTGSTTAPGHQTDFAPPKDANAQPQDIGSSAKDGSSLPQDSAKPQHDAKEPTKDSSAKGDSTDLAGADIIRKVFDNSDRIMAQGGETPIVSVSKDEHGYVVAKFKDGPLKGTVAHFKPGSKEILVESPGGNLTEVGRHQASTTVRVDKNNNVMTSSETLH